MNDDELLAAIFARLDEMPRVVYVDDPAAVSLANAERVRRVFDVSPSTWMRWHDEEGAPISWPNGRGPGKTGYIPTREARAWFKRKSERTND
jgi:hypothetical protein